MKQFPENRTFQVFISQMQLTTRQNIFLFSSCSKTEFSHLVLRNLLVEACVNIPHILKHYEIFTHDRQMNIGAFLVTHLEVLDRPDPELEGGVLVAHHQGVVVHLEGGHSPHVAHALLNRLVQRDGLVGASDQHHHLPGVFL